MKYRYKSDSQILTTIKTIRELLRKQNYNLAKKALTDFMEKYPDDILGNIEYARLMAQTGNIDDSLEIFENIYFNYMYNLIDFDKYIVYRNLFFLYFNSERYYEAVLIYPSLIKKAKEVDGKTFSIYFKIALKKIGKLKITDRTKYPYKERQLLEYSSMDTINHVFLKHSKEEENKKKKLFNGSINISELYYILKNKVLNANPIEVKNLFDIYRFKYENVGICDNNISNYIEVVCTKGNSNIITFYPTDNLIKTNEDYLSENSISKVKRISQIEKFRSKYNKKN